MISITTMFDTSLLLVILEKKMEVTINMTGIDDQDNFVKVNRFLRLYLDTHDF